MSGVPLRYLVPWPQAWLGPPPDATVLDRVLAGGLDVVVTDYGLEIACNAYVVDGIELLSVGSLVGVLVGANTEGVAVKLTLGDERDPVAFRLALSGIDVTLYVAATLLRPVLPRTDDPDPAATRLFVQTGEVALAIDASGQIAFDALPAVSLPRCVVGQTGIIVEAGEIFPKLSGEQTLPPAAAALALPDDWRGLFVGTARVTMPDGLAGILPHDLTLDRCAIGNLGFSGKVDADWSPPFGASLFGIALAMDHIGIELRDNQLVGLDLHGALTLPAVTGTDGNPTSIPFAIEAGAAGYRVVAGDIPPLKLGGVKLDLAGLAVGFDATSLTDVELQGVLQIPGLQGDDERDAEIGFDVDHAAGVYALRATSTPLLRLGPFGLRIDRLDLSFDHAGPRSTELAATLSIPGLEAVGGGPAEIGVRVGVGGDRFTVGVGALPPLKLGGMAIQLDVLVLAFGGAAPLEVEIAGRLMIPGAQDAAGNPVAIGFELEVDSSLFRIAATAIPAFEIAGVEVRLTAFRIGFNAAGIVAGHTTISGSVTVPAFKDDAGNPIEIAVTVDLSDGFEVTAVLPAGELEVLSIADTLRVALRKLGVGVGAAGIRFRIGGRIDNHLEIPLVGDLLPSTIEINELGFRAPNDLDLDLALAWPNGLRAGSDGSGGFEVEIPVGEIGAGLSLDAIGLRLRATGNAYEFAIVFRGATLEIGPVLGVVDGLGLAATITPAPGGGNIGPLDVALLFVPPKGIGLAIELPGVSGGGFLSHAPGTYAGVLQVAVQDTVTLTVIGLLTTEGQKTFSLRLFGSAQFSPIQLGYGFSLTGLGLAIAIESGMDAEALRRAVYEGSLRSLLFPPDPVANARQIIADLAAFFPPREGCTVIGVMAQIGWGPGTPLVKADVGIFIELSGSVRLVLAGVAYAALPNEQAPILVLNVQLLGVLDFDAKTLAIDTSLRGSRLLHWALDGSVALRAAWGDRPHFVLSAGGFYPGYRHSADFLALDRIGLTIGSGNPHVVLYSYFAITENSVQIGAELLFELRKKLGFGSVTIEVAGSTGYDAIARFDPFRFDAEMHGCFAVRCNGKDLLAISLRLMLQGPNPYHVQGQLRFEVLEHRMV